LPHRLAAEWTVKTTGIALERFPPQKIRKLPVAAQLPYHCDRDRYAAACLAFVANLTVIEIFFQMPAATRTAQIVQLKLPFLHPRCCSVKIYAGNIQFSRKTHHFDAGTNEKCHFFQNSP
jgi:hypothetical protein